MENYVVGWDGGGTKTAMQIRDSKGRVVYNTKAGGLNYNAYTQEQIAHNIKVLVDEMKSVVGELDTIISMCIATAGVSNPKSVEFISKTLENMGIKCKPLIIGDHEVALYGAFEDHKGIILVSGTGSICFGVNGKGETHRTGGWGHIIDDVGSAYAVGCHILSMAVKIYDEREDIDDTLLEDVLNKIKGNDIKDIIEFIYNKTTTKKEIAALSTILLETPLVNNSLKMKICEKAAYDLASLVLPVARKLKLENGKITFCGGILIYNHYIRNILIEVLKEKLPELNVVKPKYDTVSSAAMMAFNKIKTL